jgi:ArsR family transcriptional regulator
MKLCLPTMGDAGLIEPLHGHFGNAAYFTICDTESGDVRSVAIDASQHAHGQCQPVTELAALNVDAVVTGGMGRRAVMLLNEAGMKVYRMVGGTVADALAAHQRGELLELSQEGACSGHSHGND